MKKGFLVDLVYSSVNGGRANTDSVVTKAQIKALLPAAINYSATGAYWDNLSSEGDRDVPMSFISELPSKEVKKDDRGRDYVDLPEPLMDVGGNGGVRVVEDGMGNYYGARLQGSGNSHWGAILRSIKEYSRVKGKLILHNNPPLVEKIYVSVMLDASQIDDDDELPIPTGREPEVIDILTSFFTNQKMMPKDYIINGVDPRIQQ